MQFTAIKITQTSVTDTGNQCRKKNHINLLLQITLINMRATNETYELDWQLSLGRHWNAVVLFLTCYRCSFLKRCCLNDAYCSAGARHIHLHTLPTNARKNKITYLLLYILWHSQFGTFALSIKRIHVI